MKKILFVSRELTHMYFHLEYIKHLIKNGNEVHIACKINKDTTDFTNELIKVHNIDFERKAVTIKHKKAYLQIKKLCQDEQYDFVHMHTPIAAFIGRCAVRKLNVKVIYTAHGLHFFKGASIINWLIYYPLEKIASKWTDAMILINNEDFNRVNKKIKLRNNGKVYFLNGVGINLNVFNGISNEDADKYKKDFNISNNNFVISCVAELNKNKNQIQLLKAIGQCKNRNNIIVMLIGEGSEEESLKKYCNEVGLSNVMFLGYRRDVQYLLAISDVLALVSKREGLPKSLMEGMASSLAILGTDTRGIRDLVEDGVNGYIVKCDDYMELRNKIDLLYENRELLNNMKANSRSMAKKYDINSIIGELDRIYMDIGLKGDNYGENSKSIR